MLRSLQSRGGPRSDIPLSNAGYDAMNSLRLDRGYRALGPDLTPDHNPVQAGLRSACKLQSGLDFVGGTCKINVAGRLHATTVGLRAPVEPSNERVWS